MGSNNKGERIMNKWNKVSIVFVGFMMLATVGVFLYTIFTFNEVKKQFDLENRPLVILIKSHADTIKEMVPINDTLIIKNVGKAPAYFIYARFGHSLDTILNPQKLTYSDTIATEPNRFIESNATFTFLYKGVLNNSKFYSYISTGKILLHNFGEVVYKDIVSGKKYSYKFSVRILSNGQTQPTRIGDKVEEIKE